MDNDKLIHDWLVSYLKHKLSRDYKEININLEGEKNSEFEGHYPDLILGNHGMILAVMEVETEKSITPEKSVEWKALTALGVKLIIMVPSASKSKLVDLLWKAGIVDKASVGSYEITVRMP
ncbi:MAG: hypothetical protein KAJ34_08205 [Thermodesulfovibrionia bacterium]|nr:hypothetical protein [Thermodesulfovibrionia bacterium]MCK5512760.1 hypothetical protein [Thermodesulfovibrionia bacterium]